MAFYALWVWHSSNSNYNKGPCFNLLTVHFDILMRFFFATSVLRDNFRLFCKALQGRWFYYTFSQRVTKDVSHAIENMDSTLVKWSSGPSDAPDSSQCLEQQMKSLYCMNNSPCLPASNKAHNVKFRKLSSRDSSCSFVRKYNRGTCYVQTSFAFLDLKPSILLLQVLPKTVGPTNNILKLFPSSLPQLI